MIDRTTDEGPPGTEFLPSYSFHERHDSRPLCATPAEIIAAVEAIEMQDDRVTRALLAVRQLPARLCGRDDSEGTERFGFSTFTPLRRTQRELTLGLAGQFWRVGMQLATLHDADAFSRFVTPGNAKLVLRFLVLDRPDGLRTLRTETFVHCPDSHTRRRMTPYWWVIRLPSGWIRRRTLDAVHRMLQPGT
ncbi:hypothetical protein ACFPTO_00850 [Paraburkholderia denitrificans]|uniref:DUF2867 domain-containing protein n=1 Tax=Paraburkholderia denitrificans TaxID=694025 RepID=A0ABW0J2W8_9BURK